MAKEVEVPVGRWSQLSVHVAGNLFRVFLNRDKLFEVEDGTFFECRQDRTLDQGGLCDVL